MQLSFKHLENFALLAFVGLAGCSIASTETSTPESARTEDPVPTPKDDPSPYAAPSKITLRSPNTTTTGAEALAAVDDNLQRLRDLAVFEVGDLIVDLPAEATNCYGAPCPGSEDEILAAQTDAAVRLANFVDVAETAAASGYAAYACFSRVDVNLEALRALSIVEVGTFIEAQPQNNPNCYNLPCESDINAAAMLNETRAADLESIALATPGL